MPILEEEHTLKTRLWKGSLRTYITVDEKITIPEEHSSTEDLSDTVSSGILVSPSPSSIDIDDEEQDDELETIGIYKPLNVILQKNNIVRITKGKYEDFIAVVSGPIYIEDKPIKHISQIEKAWDTGFINLDTDPSKKFIKEYPNNSIRLGNQYYVHLELHIELYKEVGEMMGKTEEWLDDYFANITDKYGSFPKKKKFLYLIVPPLQERTLPEEILLSVYQKHEIELIASSKAKQHCTRQLLKIQQKKTVYEPITVLLPTLKTYVVGKDIKSLKDKISGGDEPFGNDILVYEKDEEEDVVVEKSKVFVYDF